MSTSTTLRLVTAFSAATALLTPLAHAQSNIDPANRFSWAENMGHMNWRDADGSLAGVRVNIDHLEGNIWSENFGYINVGPGAGPYANLTGLDYGVNILAAGDLTGFGWGENIGWVNFDTAAALGGAGLQARFDSATGRFFGFAWSENLGWINLNHPVEFVAILSCPADLDGDGVVGPGDLGLLLGAWGPCAGCPADFNNDGFVNAADLAQLLGAWGPCP